MAKKLGTGVFALLLFGWTAPADAQDPLITDRPDFTESAAVIERGHVQLEGGTTFTRFEDTDELALGEILLRIGIAPRLELRLAPGSYVWIDGPEEEVDGLEDAAIGAKAMLAEGEIPVAVLFGTSVPTGSHDVGGGVWEPEVKLALAREAGNASMGTNVGWVWTEGEDERLHRGLASATVGLPLGERAGLFLETYGFVTEGAGGEEAYFDAGVTRLLSDDFQLDARLGVGLGADSADWFAGVGAARRW